MAHLGRRVRVPCALDGAVAEEGAPAFLQVGCELRRELVVFPSLQDRIPETGLPELQREDAVEDGGALRSGGGMPLARAGQENDDRQRREPPTVIVPSRHRVNLTRIGGETEAILFPLPSLAASKRV